MSHHSRRHQCPRCPGTSFVTAAGLLRHSLFHHSEALRDPSVSSSQPKPATSQPQTHSPPPPPTPASPTPPPSPNGTIHGPFEQEILYPFQSSTDCATTCVICLAPFFHHQALKRHQRLVHTDCHVNYSIVCRLCQRRTGSDGRSGAAHFRAAHQSERQSPSLSHEPLPPQKVDHSPYFPP